MVSTHISKQARARIALPLLAFLLAGATSRSAYAATVTIMLYDGQGTMIGSPTARDVPLGTNFLFPIQGGSGQAFIVYIDDKGKDYCDGGTDSLGQILNAGYSKKWDVSTGTCLGCGIRDDYTMQIGVLAPDELCECLPDSSYTLMQCGGKVRQFIASGPAPGSRSHTIEFLWAGKEVPTVSVWGMVVLALLLSVGAKVYLGSRQLAGRTA